MTNTYTQHADICAKFYQLTIDPTSVVDFVLRINRAKLDQKILFVGGMFGVAAELINRGHNLTIVDYTDEMVAVGKSYLPSIRIDKADLRDLPYQKEFDHVVVVGRVFTHMLSESDLTAAVQSCRNSLKPGGRLFADNYEDSRIRATSYFNGIIKGSDQNAQIIRESTTKLVSNSPFVVQWTAKYFGTWFGERFSFDDSMEHRAFSRPEFANYLTNAGFQILSQGDNFDETSFFTCAENLA